MRFNTLLLLAGLLALAFGLGFLLLPGAVLPLYGVEPAPATVMIARFFGVALVHLGLALYLVRETRDAAIQRGLALSGVVGSAAGVAVALTGVLGGLVNDLGWSTVAIYGLLLIGYAGGLRPRPLSA